MWYFLYETFIYVTLMSISPRFVQDLRDRLTLSETIGRRVKLTRAGREFKGCCPFHREKTPSFYVNDDKQFFHCFGCGAHGDVLGFVMRHDNLSFVEAIEILAAQAGLAVPQQSEEEHRQSREEKSLYALCEAAAQWFEARLHDPIHRDVLKYVTERGLSREVIDGFRLGYAPQDDQVLRKFLSAQGFTDRQMIDAGLIKASTKGGEPYAFFRDRVMFPVADVRGRVVAFGGRILPEHLRPPSRSDFKPPKYINSPDTQLFHKGRMLYAGQHARLAAQDHPLMVVEGYMDVLACHQAGYKGAVAPLGTAMTEDQIMVLWKMIPHDTKEPILCFDGDEAGYRAALRAAERVLPLLKPDQSVRFSFLPEGYDPDTYLREYGAEAFQKRVGQSVSLIDFLWMHKTSGRDFSSPETRAGLSQQLDGLSDKIPDRNLQYYYKQMFREKTRKLFGATWAPSKDSKFAGKKAIQSVTISLPQVGQQKVAALSPQIMLLTIINHPRIWPYIESEYARLGFLGDEWGALHQATERILENMRDEGELETLDAEAFQTQLKEVGVGDDLARLMEKNLYLHAGFARAGEDDAAALEGWKSLWNQWDKSIISDLMAARSALIAAMTPENESRLMALQSLKRGEGNEGRVEK